MAAEHRLPDTVRPEKYSIELRPNLKAFSFEGSESIRIQVARPTKTIVLNAEGLEVREATVSSSKGGSLPATSIDFDSNRAVSRLDVAVPPRLRDWPPRYDRRQGPAGHEARRVGPSGPDRPQPLGPRRSDPHPRLPERLLWHSVSAREARPHRAPGFRRGRDGELGRDHVPGADPALRPRHLLRADAADDRRGHRPRDGPHVVRGPRHDGVVGRP